LYRWTNVGTSISVQFDIYRKMGIARRTLGSRIETARTAFMDKRRLFTSKMNSELKKRIMFGVE